MPDSTRSTALIELALGMGLIAFLGGLIATGLPTGPLEGNKVYEVALLLWFIVVVPLAGITAGLWAEKNIEPGES